MSDFSDPGAEATVLAAFIAQPALLPVAISLDPATFTTPAHQLVCEALQTIARCHDPLDHATVARRASQGAVSKAQAATVNQLVMGMIGKGEDYSIGFFLDRLANLRTAREAQAVVQRLGQMVDESLRLDDLSILETGVEHAVEELSGLQVSSQPTADDLPMSLDELLAKKHDHNWLIPELLEVTDRLVITGFEGTGKALAIDTPIPTPEGWTTMGKLNIGDQVFTPSGKPVEIVAATDVMFDRPCYRVSFSDGSEIIADENHLWETETLAARESAARQRRRGATKKRGTDQRHRIVHTASILTTGQIRDSLHTRGGHCLNHSIRVTAPLEFSERALPIHPYVLGAWLGDGTTQNATLTCADEEIVEQIRACGEVIRKADNRYLWRFGDGNRRISREAKAQTLQTRLRVLGVLGDKHIPESYLTGSVEQRLALLQGLMDTDGTIDTNGLCEFTVCNERLARGFLEMVCTLGIKATIRESPAMLGGREVNRRWRIGFKTDLPVFRLTRKAQRLKPLPTNRAKLRYITAVDPVESVPVRCIQVANPDGMFVAGEACIPTHNSFLIAQLVMCVAAGLHPFLGMRVADHARVLVIDAENSERQTSRRYRRLRTIIEKRCASLGVEIPDWSEMVRFVIRPEGIALNDPRTVRNIEKAVAATRPQFVAMGPLYRLHRLDTRDEQAAKELTDAIDRLRVKYQFALVAEAHVAHGAPGAQRALRPTGSSLFLRWPEFGFGLRPAQGTENQQHPDKVDLVAWRGGREERMWPSQLQHSVNLPWGNADPDYYDQARRLGIA
ncbi:AAA family ATPase [uncultured Gordonia sp.]|uniref:AAA family ATPase n=1 Tax=uncultured Gordonia sp. TaxID=198437 RepID=UPI002588C046|nr:AAA family ATPase [uncultured Gordonia sp.]